MINYFYKLNYSDKFIYQSLNLKELLWDSSQATTLSTNLIKILLLIMNICIYATTEKYQIEELKKLYKKILQIILIDK